jgi:hypothetical protein
VVGGSARGWLQVDDLRRVSPFFSLAFTLVAAVTQPSSSADLALAAVPVAAWTLWALVRARTVVALELADGRVAHLAETSGRLVAGPASERQRPYYGLIGMQERARSLGGEFAAGRTRDGWRVRCELPLEDEGAGDPSRHR